MAERQEATKIASQLCVRAKDVMALTGYGRTTAYQIMDDCRKDYGGLIKGRPDAITTESLMRYFNTTREDFIKSFGEQP